MQPIADDNGSVATGMHSSIKYCGALLIFYNTNDYTNGEGMVTTSEFQSVRLGPNPRMLLSSKNESLCIARGIFRGGIWIFQGGIF